MQIRDFLMDPMIASSLPETFSFSNQTMKMMHMATALI
jgi:hypothetical protein